MLVSLTMRCLWVAAALLFSSCGNAKVAVDRQKTGLPTTNDGIIDDESVGTVDGQLTTLEGAYVSLPKSGSKAEPCAHNGISSKPDHRAGSIALSQDGNYFIFTKDINKHWSLFHTFGALDNAWPKPFGMHDDLKGVEGLDLSRGLVARDGKYLILYSETDSRMHIYRIPKKSKQTLRV